MWILLVLAKTLNKHMMEYHRNAVQAVIRFTAAVLRKSIGGKRHAELVYIR
jgi:hypothetical protein